MNDSNTMNTATELATTIFERRAKGSEFFKTVVDLMKTEGVDPFNAYHLAISRDVSKLKIRKMRKNEGMDVGEESLIGSSLGARMLQAVQNAAMYELRATIKEESMNEDHIKAIDYGAMDGLEYKDQTEEDDGYASEVADKLLRILRALQSNVLIGSSSWDIPVIEMFADQIPEMVEGRKVWVTIAKAGTWEDTLSLIKERGVRYLAEKENEIVVTARTFNYGEV
jgi:hypothetical protein